MARTDRIRSYRERTLDLAALIAALASARADDEKLERLAERQDAQLADLLHDFAFLGRKLIELTEREGLGAASRAKKKSLFCSREGPDEGDDDIAMLSIWDAFGRIIHSDTLVVKRGHVPQPDGNPHPIASAWGFNVTSDRDRPGTHHFVFIEFLLAEYLLFDDALQRDLARVE
jgi:hypothetical protein